ncbi:MAG: hypothetical protein ACJ0BL_05575 [Dehalococcoidia bacterium]
MINEKAKNAISKAWLPALIVATVYYITMCSVFGVDKSFCVAGSVSIGAVVFVSLSVLRSR